MPANLEQPFAESCCDGGACNISHESAQPCGCDKGAGWICARHREEKRMTVSEYESFVESNAKSDLDLTYAVIAINGEAGEIAEWFKKYHLRGNPGGALSKDDLKLELGDLQYYLTRCAALGGWTMTDIMEANVAKLRSRKGQGLRDGA